MVLGQKIQHGRKIFLLSCLTPTIAHQLYRNKHTYICIHIIPIHTSYLSLLVTKGKTVENGLLYKLVFLQLISSTLLITGNFNKNESCFPKCIVDQDKGMNKVKNSKQKPKQTDRHTKQNQ